MKHKLLPLVLVSFLVFIGNTTYVVYTYSGSNAKLWYSPNDQNYASALAKNNTVLIGRESDGNLQFAQSTLSESVVSQTTTSNSGTVNVTVVAGDSGNVALGWFSQNLSTTYSILVSFDVRVRSIAYSGTSEWVRLGAVGTVRDNNSGDEYYTELDFWDSPATYSGLLYGDVFRGGNTVEYKWAYNINAGSWYAITVDMLKWMKKDWSTYLANSSFRFWSFYVVAEFIAPADGSANLVLDVKNFKIRDSDPSYSLEIHTFSSLDNFGGIWTISNVNTREEII